ncbi:MAG: tRNA (guanosine(37)-N1)-methyltransferase TrmD [Candidatus Eiseniibacteriota bacterium]
MRISIVTIFPDMFPAPLDEGMIRIARERGVLEVALVNLRDHTKDKHRSTDDAPFGGGVGMIMLAEPFFQAVEAVAPDASSRHVVLLSPQGRPFRQEDAIRFSKLEHLVLLCGRYKGVDERVSEHLVTEEISIGDFVLSGGEPAALCVVDAVARLLPGVLGTFDSAESDSFHSGLLDSAYFTRPAEFRGWAAPELLLSGDHGKIARWRREDALRRTLARRPELLEGAALDEHDRRFLARLRGEPDPPPRPRKPRPKS